MRVQTGRDLWRLSSATRALVSTAGAVPGLLCERRLRMIYGFCLDLCVVVATLNGSVVVSV